MYSVFTSNYINNGEFNFCFATGALFWLNKDFQLLSLNMSSFFHVGLRGTVQLSYFYQ